ncbi:MAG: HD domain-containing protein [Candidatus Hydrothermales bacterium]
MRNFENFINFLNRSPFNEVIKFFVDREIDFYIVGGALRDFLVGRNEIKDLDVLVPIDPQIMIRDLSKKIGASYILLDKKEKEWRVIINKNFTLDIKEIKEDINYDLLERDFTINSLALKYKDKSIVDITGGLNDIKNRIVRAVKRENLIEDPLRMLRAFRFMATLNYEIDEDTLEFIKKNSDKIVQSARERINKELFLIFSEGKIIHKTLLKIKETGLLFVLIPELKSMEGCLQIYKNRSLDILQHTLNCVYYLEKFYKNYKKTFFGEYENYVEEIFYPENRVLLFLSIIFHDVGKPLTRTQEGDRTRFIGHDRIGANIAYRWAKEMRFSEKFSRKLRDMVYFHMYPHLLGREEEITKRAIYRYLKKVGDLWLLLIVHAYADFRATPPGKDSSYLKRLLKNIHEFKLESEREKLKPLINGYDLIDLGLKPGPIFKVILNEVEELRAEGILKTKEEALEFVKKNYIER